MLSACARSCSRRLARPLAGSAAPSGAPGAAAGAGGSKTSAAAANRARRARQASARRARTLLAAGAALGACGYLATTDSGNSALRAVTQSQLWRAAAANWDEMVKPFTDPVREKLLPDWPLPNVPPGMPCPLTLVLDLEDTLVHSEWSRKHGWRHAKRPGLDKFLLELAQYYEIVVFTSTVAGVADPIITAADPKQCCIHRLYREATRFVDGKHVKDLSMLNRPLNRIIIVDDDPDSFSLHPDHAIQLKPFLDGRDKGDRALEDALPMLLGMARENVQDVPAVLRSYGAPPQRVEGYKRRVVEHMQSKEQQRRSGLGGLIRNRSAAAAAAPAAPAVVSRADPEAERRAREAEQRRARAAAADSEAKKSKSLFGRYQQYAKESEEKQLAKQQEWQREMVARREAKSQ